jgi:hypothetical protein
VKGGILHILLITSYINLLQMFLNDYITFYLYYNYEVFFQPNLILLKYCFLIIKIQIQIKNNIYLEV